jgi:hypothetical protein
MKIRDQGLLSLYFDQLHSAEVRYNAGRTSLTMTIVNYKQQSTSLSPGVWVQSPLFSHHFHIVLNLGYHHTARPHDALCVHHDLKDQNDEGLLLSHSFLNYFFIVTKWP